MRPAPPVGTAAALTVKVTEELTARVGRAEIHPVYGTAALIADMEEVSRALLLPLLEDGEEGVGAEICARHHAPVPVGAEVVLTATVSEAGPRHLTCSVEAHSGGELVASGSFEQRVVPLARFRAAIEERAAAVGGPGPVTGGARPTPGRDER